MSIKLSYWCTWEAAKHLRSPSHNSDDASLMLSNLLRASYTWRMHTNHINIVNNYYLQCTFFIFFTFLLCRAFDLANHFCEWMIDYTVAEPVYFSVALDKWPSKEQQVFWKRSPTLVALKCIAFFFQLTYCNQCVELKVLQLGTIAFAWLLKKLYRKPLGCLSTFEE